MRILHIIQSPYLERGGPTKVASDLTEALVKKGMKISLFAPIENGRGQNLIHPKGVDLKLFRVSFFTKLWSPFSPALAYACQKEIENFDIIHVHEIWNHSLLGAYRAATRGRKPYVVTIHGTLEPWCLSQKAFKKKIYSALVLKRVLRKASALHAITEGEVKGISAFVDNRKLCVIPNGVNLEDFRDLPAREEIEKAYPELSGKKVILFLGRIHPKKGLNILAKAFGAILKKRRDIQLVIAGPDDCGYKSNIERILNEESALDNTTFTGMLTGADKLAALSGADVFVIPSYSEGFSMSILEAMACGLPVIITRQCNFQEVAKAGAGEVIEPNVAQLEKVLIKLLNNPKVCIEMGKRGKRLVEDKFTWDKIASQMMEVYERILRYRNGFEVVSCP
jgi:glycosyltransferase involved in cell wall biosynthesis